MRRWGRLGTTNVGYVDLTAGTTTTAAAAAAATHHTSSSVSTAAVAALHTTAEAAAASCSSCLGVAESRLSLAVLEMGKSSKASLMDKTLFDTYFADVDETTHEVLVAERCDCTLCLLPCSILHNSGIMVSSVLVSQPRHRAIVSMRTYPHPYINHGHNVPPVNPSIPTRPGGRRARKRVKRGEERTKP